MRGILLTAAAGALILSSSALAAIDVIFCQVAGHPKAVVPPGSGLAGGTEFKVMTATGFDRPFASPDGTKFFFTGLANVATTEDECFIVLDGKSATVVAREGTNIGSPVGADLIGTNPQRMGINDSGHFVFGTNVSPATTNDDVIIKWDGVSFTYFAQEGQPVPGVAGENYGATLQSPHILADGTVAYVAGGTVGLLTTAQDDFCFIGGTALIQHGVTPIGAFLWDVFNTSDLWVTPDGKHWLMVGDDTNPTTTEDKIVVVDGAVVVREGQPLPGSGYTSPVQPALGTYEITLCNDGSWILRSHNEDGVDDEDWVVRNGTLIASTDEPIMPSSTELFDDAPLAQCFFLIAGNSVGDYVVGGITNAADLDANAVLVLNGTEVIAREGDMVDLNGNGLDDDDAFITTFSDDDCVLTDNLNFVFFANIIDGLGTSLGQMVLQMDLAAPAPCPGDIDNSGHVNVNDLLAVITTWGPCPGCPPATCPGDISPAGGDCNIDVNDLLQVVTTWGPCP